VDLIGDSVQLDFSGLSVPADDQFGKQHDGVRAEQTGRRQFVRDLDGHAH